MDARSVMETQLIGFLLDLSGCRTCFGKECLPRFLAEATGYELVSNHWDWKWNLLF